MPESAYEIAIGQSHAVLSPDEKALLYARVGPTCSREAVFRRVCQQMYPRVTNRSASLYYEHTYVLNDTDSVFHLNPVLHVTVPPRQRASFRNAAIRHLVLGKYAARTNWALARRRIF